jgi:hypothetical protein
VLLDVFFLKEKEMSNGSIHPKEQELKERLGKDYEVETTPPAARIYGEADVSERKEEQPEAAGKVVKG